MSDTDIQPSATDELVDPFAHIWAEPKDGEPDPDFNIDKYCVALMQRNAFFASISRQIQKIRTYAVNTAAVAYDKANENIVLLWNPKFFDYISNHPMHPQFGDCYVEGLITHEFYHIILDHMSVRKQDPHDYWNIATDAAIDSLITEGGGHVPPGLIVPGVTCVNPDGTDITDPKMTAPGSIYDVIKNWPKLQSSEWYFQDLKHAAKSGNWPQKIVVRVCRGKGKCDGEYQFESIDNHDGWDDIPEEERSVLTEKIRQMCERAAHDADAVVNGWGNIPECVKQDIRKFISRIVDWRTIVRQFVGRIARGERRLSIKRINKKYPYIHPGTARGYTCKLAVCMDQSGSVSQQNVELFFAVLGALTQRVSITVIPFDHSVAVDGIFEWKKGAAPKLQRVRQGGTCFDAPTDFVNDPKNRGRWDGVVFLTDGEAAKPKSSRMKRAYVICPNHKLLFDTDELVVTMTTDTPRTSDSPVR